MVATPWAPAAAPSAAPAWPVVRRLDLAGAFATRSPWRLVVTQGPPTADYGDNPAPGALRLCLHARRGAPCVDETLGPSNTGGVDWGPHDLQVADLVHPNGAGAPPLLRLVTASLHAGDGAQDIATQLLRYDRGLDVFVRIYGRVVGTNNNQEVRFIEGGPLRGDIIAAEPTGSAPFGYWITVSRLASDGAYRVALRYRSATRYGDGDRLPAIDSEMPAIQRRLGVRKAGDPLPLPLGPCPKPRLRGGELWCE